MSRCFASLLALPLTCGPLPPADTDSDATSSSSSSGDDGTTSTTSGTGGVPTGIVGPESGPSTGATSEADSPDREVRVHVVEMRPSVASGVDGLPRWIPEPAAEWCAQDVPGCGGVPTLGEPLWVVNGTIADVEAIQIGTRVAVLLPFEHPGCGLACGMAVTEVLDEVEGGGGVGSLPADLPCGTASSGVWLALDFGAIVRGGEHRAALRLEDRCGASTEAWSVVFEV